MGSRLRPVAQLVLAELLVEHVEHDPRLGDAAPVLGIHGDDPVAVLAVVQDDGGVRALAGQARPAAAREQRGLVLAADRHRLRRGVNRARHDDAQGELPEIGGIGRVGAASPRVEADLAVNARSQVALERRLLYRSRDRHGARRYPIARPIIPADGQTSAR
jgi:hypothetical protein